MHGYESNVVCCSISTWLKLTFENKREIIRTNVQSQRHGACIYLFDFIDDIVANWPKERFYRNCSILRSRGGALASHTHTNAGCLASSMSQVSHVIIINTRENGVNPSSRSHIDHIATTTTQIYYYYLWSAVCRNINRFRYCVSSKHLWSRLLDSRLCCWRHPSCWNLFEDNSNDYKM